jgi:7-keto-8-aminopelargonate synthetase-like enzyme
MEALFAAGPRREQVFSLACFFHDRLVDAGWQPLNDRGSHILALDFASREAGERAWKRLLEAGIYAGFLRYPTVSRGHSRLRFCVCWRHSREVIMKTITLLEQEKAREENQGSAI